MSARSLAMVEALCDVSKKTKQGQSARRLLYLAMFATLLLLLLWFVGGRRCAGALRKY